MTLSEALQKTIEKVDGHQTSGKLKKCNKCGHWHSKEGQSEINHRRFCTGKIDFPGITAEDKKWQNDHGEDHQAN